MNIDACDFPLVRMQNDPALAVPVDEVLAQNLELLQRGEPFVVIGEGLPNEGEREDENVDDRRKVALFMKANKTEIRRLIKGHIQIVPEVEKRDGAESFSVMFEKFWGYPMFVVATEQEAQAKAKSLLNS